MKKKIRRISAALTAVLIMVFMMAATASAADDRPAGAKVFADFNGSGSLAAGSIIPGSETWLNFVNDATLSLENGALKVIFKPNGNFGLGNPAIFFADGNGTPQYKYLVFRLRGEKGNENRTEAGGFLLSVGGSEGSHMRSLNDREVGTSPPALGADGKVIPPFSTSYQNFVIELKKENVRQASTNAISLNINCVSNSATIYIDEIYVSDTMPASVAKPGTPVVSSNPTVQSTASTANTVSTPPGNTVSSRQTSSANTPVSSANTHSEPETSEITSSESGGEVNNGGSVTGISPDTNVEFFAEEGVVPEGTGIIADLISKGPNFTFAKTALKETSFTLYDISLMKDNARVTLNGSVKLSIPLPGGYDGASCKVYHIDDNGSIKDMNAVLENGKLVFNTNHFSLFAVAEGDGGADAETGTISAVLVAIIVALVIILVGGGLAVVYFLVIRKKSVAE